MSRKFLDAVEIEGVNGEVRTKSEAAEFARSMGTDPTEVVNAMKLLKTSSKKALAEHFQRIDYFTDILSAINELPINKLAEIKRIVRNIAFDNELQQEYNPDSRNS